MRLKSVHRFSSYEMTLHTNTVFPSISKRAEVLRSSVVDVTHASHFAPSLPLQLLFDVFSFR
jgi:hypothetical protein